MADNNNLGTVGIIISLFIAVLIGAVILNISAGQVNDLTGLDYTTDSAQLITRNTTGIDASVTYTVSEAPTGWKAASDSGCALTNFVLTNGTTGGAGTFTVTTDYVVDLQHGTYTMVNSATALALLGGETGNDNSTVASYNNCPDGYQSGFGGASLNLIPGFFALAILVSVAFLIFWILRREGVDI